MVSMENGNFLEEERGSVLITQLDCFFIQREVSIFIRELINMENLDLWCMKKTIQRILL